MSREWAESYTGSMIVVQLKASPMGIVWPKRIAKPMFLFSRKRRSMSDKKRRMHIVILKYQ